MEREEETSFVNRQCYHQSQGCLLIVNAVVEAKVVCRSSMLSHIVIEVKEQEIWQGERKKMASMTMHTAEHFPGDVFPSKL